MKTVSIIAMVSVCLLVGCATNKHPEKFSGGPAQKIAEGDEFKIEAAVYGYLLGRHLSDQDEYSAIFLEGSDAEVAALIQKFPHHVPPIKPSSRIELHPNQAPIDKDTGKPALILSARAMDPTNGVSEAIGTWYAGGAVSGLYAFVLTKVDGEWIIQSAR
jgi:hypothetical protein